MSFHASSFINSPILSSAYIASVLVHASHVQQVSKSDALEFSWNFHHLLLSVRETICENFCPISVLALIFWSFKFFRANWLFLLFWFFTFSQANYFKSSFPKDIIMLSYYTHKEHQKFKPNEAFNPTFFNDHLKTRKKPIKWTRADHFEDF